MVYHSDQRTRTRRRGVDWCVLSPLDETLADFFRLVRGTGETAIPADLILIKGTCIVNEAMLSGESTPLLKESIELNEGTDRLDLDGAHKGNALFSGTKVLQASGGVDTPDGGSLAVVLRTGFGTAQGQLVRTMIFSTERVSANNFESFLFIGFLLIFAIAASWYVWTKGTLHFPALRLNDAQPHLRPGTWSQEIEAVVGLRSYHHECCASRTPHGAVLGRKRLFSCPLQIW